MLPLLWPRCQMEQMPELQSDILFAWKYTDLWSFPFFRVCSFHQSHTITAAAGLKADNQQRCVSDSLATIRAICGLQQKCDTLLISAQRGQPLHASLTGRWCQVYPLEPLQIQSESVENNVTFIFFLSFSLTLKTIMMCWRNDVRENLWEYSTKFAHNEKTIWYAEQGTFSLLARVEY